MSPRLRPLWLLAACLLIYLVFLTKSYYWDGVLFSLDIESVYSGRVSGIALFHPNHLFYNAVGYALYAFAATVWPGIRAITILQIANVLASVLTAYLVFVIARRITNNVQTGLFCLLLFAAGATWWKFSTDADSYVIAVLFLLLTAFFLLQSKSNLLAAALCHTVAMLFHELAIFTYIPVLVLFLITRRIRAALLYCLGTGSSVASAYWLCYARADHTSYPTLLAWVTSYASDSGFTHSISDITAHYLLSFLKLFAGGKFSLIRQFFGVVECAAFIACIALMIWGIRAFKHSAAMPDEVDRRARVFLWAWFLGYALFLAIWDPGSAFHKLFIWPAIVLLIGVYARSRIRALTFFAAALAAWNFGAFIYPHSHATADPVLVLAEKVNRELPKNATVYYRVLDPDDWYLEYFAPGRKWRPIVLVDQLPLSAPVCYETTALSEAPWPTDPNLKWDLVNSAHNIRLECLARSP